ncbi:hypothetical protein [Actinoplanes sp. NPDC049265]|uniref:hypothetical protein n=1 Tax=Actinoplanes sp. NPDC049265 TaxID=3363902 RepID=UPI003721DA32
MSGTVSQDHLTGWISSVVSVAAPAGALSALLFYFGYVSARSKYEYFGVDVDTIELSTKEYIMRSPQPLLVPLLGLALTGAGLLALHVRVRNRIVAARASDNAAAFRRRIDRATRAATIAGAVVLGLAVVVLLSYSELRRWPLYGLVTPLLFVVGGGTVTYASRVSSLLRNAYDEEPGPGQPVPAASSHRAVTILTYAAVAVSVFWSAATIAQWSGRGQAQDAARHLDRLPRVILDTKERLFLRSPGVEETTLPPSPGQSFRYRYRRLHLLIVGRNRMFLVPETWSASNSTLVVPLNDSVRVQFQFQNQSPPAS